MPSAHRQLQIARRVVAACVAEPGGAVALAAALAGKIDPRGLALTLSGGNVDVTRFAEMVK